MPDGGGSMHIATVHAGGRVAKPKKRRAFVPVDDFGPTPEQRARFQYERVKVAEIDPVEQPIGEAPRNRTATPLDAYRHKRAITDRQYEAGDRFRNAWGASGLDQHVSGQYQPSVSGERHAAFLIPVTHHAARARAEYREAVQRVGIRLARVLEAVCCYEATAEQLTKYRNRGQALAAGMELLRFALDELADHYNLR